MYTIPLFDINFDINEEEAIISVLKSKWLSMGPKCEEFESSFSTLIDANYALAISNCTHALHLALETIDIHRGDEVIVPSLTFVATVNAIKYLDAIPVFADINSYEDLTISPSDIEKKITPKTKAIIVMHYGGFPCDMSTVIQIAKKYNLRIIEDAAHAPYSEYNSIKLGTIGDIGCFSFFSNKNISTGEGGMLVTNNIEFYEKAKLLRSHGMTSMSYQRSLGHATEYDVTSIGFNYRLDDIRSAIGCEQIKKLVPDLFKRKEIRNRYIDGLHKLTDIIIPFKENENFVSNYIFPIVLRNSNRFNRDRIREFLHSKGIQTSIHYPAVHKFSIYNNSTSLPITEYTSDNEITLPMYASLSVEQINSIVMSIKQALAK